VKVPCSGLLPSIKVGLCYLRKWRRGNSTGKVAFHHSIFSKVLRRLHNLSMK